MTKKKKKVIPPLRKREVEKYEQRKIVVAPSSIFDVNQYFKYEMISNNLVLINAFSVRYTVGFVFSNKYDATKIILGVEKVTSF